MVGRCVHIENEMLTTFSQFIQVCLLLFQMNNVLIHYNTLTCYASYVIGESFSTMHSLSYCPNRYLPITVKCIRVTKPCQIFSIDNVANFFYYLLSSTNLMKKS